MRLLVSEIFRVYKKAPLQILSIWLMDLFEALIIVANPYVIGKCIDGLLQQDTVWLIILVVLEVLFGISRALNCWILVYIVRLLKKKALRITPVFLVQAQLTL